MTTSEHAERESHDRHGNLDPTLERSGLKREAAEVLAAEFGKSREPVPSSWMLAYAALLTALLVGGFGWLAGEIGGLDDWVAANRDRIDEVRVAVSRSSERLARIEELLEERLPPG